MNIITCWLTLNRQCNLRCRWCYASDTGFNSEDNMNLNVAKRIIELCSSCGIRSIILIGGEPTLYKDIFDIIDYCKEKEIKTTLVTNGVLLSDKELVRQYIEHGLTSFSISLKAPNEKAYKSLTGVACMYKVLKAIENITNLNARLGVSMVITEDNIASLSEGLALAKKAGAKNFGFSFCYNFNTKNNPSKSNPYLLAKLFSQNYESLCSVLEGCNWSLEQGLPFCVWDDEAVEKINNDNHLRSICQLLAGTGLLFDTDASVIPCNAMYELKYGKFGVDFHDQKTLEEFLKKEEIKKFFSKLRRIPDEKCLTCNKAKNCGGGCVTNWTNYNFKDLEKMKGALDD